MGLLDRLKRGGHDGVPGRAVVVVNRSGGREGGSSSARSLLRARLRPLPEGRGPEGNVSQTLPGHQVQLITAHMEIPVLLDPETHEPVGVPQEGLDEAIGRYYLGLEPEHGDWQTALKAKKKALREMAGLLGPVKADLEQWTGAAKEAPGLARDFASAWKGAFKNEPPTELDPNAPEAAPVEGVAFETWCVVKVDMARELVLKGEQDAYAAECGVPAGRWEAVDSAWNARVAQHANIRELFAAAMDSR